ncbi:MAG: LysR family transcriptional regulator [Pseudomonadota bacterium]
MAKSLDRLTLLETFVRISERGSISAAARDLNLSQASASRQLSDLESRLGVQLIVRTTHSLSLTKAGMDCLTRARAQLRGWESLTESFADEAHAMRGPLRIVAPIAVGQRHLADAVLAFQRRYPEVTVDWILQDGDIRFAETGCDLWIKVGPVPDETLVVRSVRSVERLIVAAPDFLGSEASLDSPADLKDKSCAGLLPFENGRIPLTHESGRAYILEARPVFSTSNIFAARQATRLGNGFAVMPKWLVRDDLASGALLDLLPDWRAPELDINMAYAPVNRQTLRLKRLVETMVAALQEL